MSKSAFFYLLSVSLGYLIDFIIYLILVNAHFSIYLSNIAAFCVGSVVNVVLIRRFVFHDNRFKLITDIQLSFISNGIMFFLGMFLLWTLVESLRIHPVIAKLEVNALTFMANYIVRSVLFREK